MHLTNNAGFSLPIAIWLAQDDYDHRYEPNYISATSLLRPTRQLVLSRRIASADRVADVEDFIASRFGTAVHDSIEKAWSNVHHNLKKMGYPQALIDRVVVNPTEEQLKTPNIIPVYVEKRTTKEINGYLVGGKLDQVLEDELYDFKTTSVFSWIFGSKDEDHRLQGSIYRWLNPEIIKGNHVHIQYIFTDWSKAEARRQPEKYPQKRIISKSVELMSLQETEKWIVSKLQELSRFWSKPQEELPECTDKELWRSETVYKYFSDPTKTDGRSTKNFDNPAAANAFRAEKGKGVVITVPGEVKACGYCPAYDICEQRKAYNV